MSTSLSNFSFILHREESVTEQKYVCEIEISKAKSTDLDMLAPEGCGVLSAEHIT